MIIKMLKLTSKIPLIGSIIRSCNNVSSPSLEREVFGIKFKNPVGVAAGLDKNGECFNELSDFGFSFVEIGSVTPEFQLGNPKPRIFRLPKDKAIINRMGIPCNGVRSVANNIKNVRHRTIVAGSLSKNSETSNENAIKDFERVFEMLYDFVDFFVLNISCPNVKDLDKLQDTDTLENIVNRLMSLRLFYDDNKPLLLKISPDLEKEQLDRIIELVMKSGLDGVVVSNTTRERISSLNTSPNELAQIGQGGLSGRPLFEKSLNLVRYVYEKTQGQVPIVASGGIMTPQNAKEMLDSGASLVEVYTGFIYEGPSFCKRILKYLKKCSQHQSVQSATKS
ncbi:MAG: quinone-dependent dihydroorotate dehydrogenase [Bacteroidales bacterium]|nr:quinone-dependent dihydroorotate dehydrogenase [Bacteroidales bacterium]MCI2122061.1 quinone-dependent dihydroorotate dehydrogenase [Bacteroidales bacterium]MCI2146198.1 quinone-dependent dihydroorotate dehydrogenase [Bacteroidales bacterium]